MELIDSIKQVAHRAAENYLLTGNSMNDVIFQAYVAGEIENDEILKRVCEQANQNVYLSLFNDSSVDKSNIQFEMADWNEILTNIKQREIEMKEYDTPPVDFRTQINPRVVESEKTAEDASVFKKLGSLRIMVNLKDRMEKLARDFESMRVSEVGNAEEAFTKMSHDARVMVANNESIGDMAKISARLAVSMGLGFEKVASAYSIIQADLHKHGFVVNSEFTKLSSMTINDQSTILEPVKTFLLSIEKAAAFKEMHDRAEGAASKISESIAREMAKS